VLEILLESVVRNFLSVIKDALVRQSGRGPDFELEQADGSRVLIEVKSSVPDQSRVSKLAEQVASLDRPADKFILVTPKPPTEHQAEQFKTAFSNVKTPASWTGLDGLAEELGVPAPGDLSSPQTLARLQLSSLIGDVNRYVTAPIGPGERPVRIESVAEELVPLVRQFPHKTISALSKDDSPLPDRLRIAQRTENVTVVLSDIVNFSSLVTASRPEELKDSMDRYYRLTREAVFSHGGMLDKFIGDAVLAVFGYPVPGLFDAVNAMKFSQGLISIGKEVLPRWQDDLNAIIQTGTRIGIATGDLWPINIGSTEVEITLLGDTINLAARLEKNCDPDSILTDNRTKTKASREDLDYVANLQLTQVQIPPSEAKGQQFPIKAWATRDSTADG